LVVFDGNYRPAGWSDAATARAAIMQFFDGVGRGLRSWEDERALGRGQATPSPAPSPSTPGRSCRGMRLCPDFRSISPDNEGGRDGHLSRLVQFEAWPQRCRV